MSKEGTPEITKSWVFVDSEKKIDEVDEGTTSSVQEVTGNENNQDSDTDSISVISESGCSYKTDEEEFVSTETQLLNKEHEDENTENLENQSEIIEKQPEIIKQNVEIFEENKIVEKLLYFATSAVCAIILIGFSVAVQHYIQGASDVDNFDPDQNIFSVKSEAAKENPPNRFNPKRRSYFKLEELKTKIPKLQEDNEYHDKILHPDRDNDPISNNKLSRNKNVAAKCNKENCDVNENLGKTHRFNEFETNEKGANDETYKKKVKELKIKEDYLKEKEKFLIEKEHDLLKKEIKLNKEKENYVKNKHDKKFHLKKEKEYNENINSDKDYSYKSNKKYKYKEEKKQFSSYKHKFTDEANKKRNITGQWYINLHEARNNMRQKKYTGLKRNKASWYFQWMVHRARLRE